MYKLICFFSAVLLFSCNNNLKTENTNLSEDKIITQQLDFTEANQTVTTNSGGKLKHLFIANGGTVGFFDDGTYASCARCDTDGSIIDMLNEYGGWGTYEEFSIYLLANGNIKWELFDNGRIIEGWQFINFKDVEFDNQITSYSIYEADKISADSIQFVNETGLVELMPESKEFEDEELEEAQNYYTAVDDLLYYLHENRARYENIGVKSIAVQKRYIVFKLNNDEDIIVDSWEEQNGYPVHAFLYRKGRIPLTVDIVDVDFVNQDLNNAQQYLK